MKPLRSATRPLLVLGLLAAAGPAMALGPECPQAYTAAMVQEDLGTMTVALRELDEAAFHRAGERMNESLPCLDAALPRSVYATAYRFLGAWRFISGDPDIATRWFRTAIEVDDTFQWDIQDLPEGHPMRRAYDGERAIAAQAPVAVREMVFDLPPGTELLVDGRSWTTPALTTGRPHLVQLVQQGSRSVVQGWLIDGNALPADLFISRSEAEARAAALAEAESKGGKKARRAAPAADPGVTSISEADVFAVQTIKRTRPAAKTPLLLTGAAGVIASGVIYGLSFPAHQKFESATTTDGLLSARTATNTLVIASGATLALSTGIGIVGIRLDSGPGLVLGRSF